MTWKTLRDALEMAAASGFDVDGGGSAATEPRRPKKTASAKPAAKWEVTSREHPAVSLPAYKGHTGRCMAIATPKRVSPHSAVAIHLVVIEGGGGRLEEGGPSVRRLRRNAPGERLRELGWVVHSAASRTCVCEAAS